ncbi:hypothetical protein K438DRAFT_1547219, partial [Mycena galopus ATCC 62051]
DVVEGEPPSGDARAEYIVDGSILAALYCFVNLTEITLKTPIGFDIDDAVAWEMARAWPRLKILKLTAHGRHEHLSSMTLLGLKAFATHCHELTALTITFDASKVPSFDDPPEMIIPPSPLRVLSVEISHITDPSAVARFLAGLFPKL